MGWRDLLLEKDKATFTMPWTGGRSLRQGDRSWKIDKSPQEYGWYSWKNLGRSVEVVSRTEAQPEMLKSIVFGYLVGDLFVPDGITFAELVISKGKPLTQRFERVFFPDDGLERFTRISAGRLADDGVLIYRQLEMPQGPEEDVRRAYEDRIPGLSQIKGVTPALDAAWQFDVLIRAETERRRAELEKQRREEEEKQQKEARRQELIKQLGSGESRRQMAQIDFAEAARAALRVSGAEYLDHRKTARKGEIAVRFRWINQRFECVVDENTLRTVEAGICLTSHGDDGFDYGERGDTYLTLESLPAVIKEASDTGQLVVTRRI